MNRIVSAALLILFAVMLISFSVRSTNVLDDLGIDLSVPELEGDGSDNTGSDDIPGSEDNPGGSDSSEEVTPPVDEEMNDSKEPIYCNFQQLLIKYPNTVVDTSTCLTSGSYYYYPLLDGSDYYIASDVKLNREEQYINDYYTNIYVHTNEAVEETNIPSRLICVTEFDYDYFSFTPVDLDADFVINEHGPSNSYIQLGDYYFYLVEVGTIHAFVKSDTIIPDIGYISRVFAGSSLYYMTLEPGILIDNSLSIFDLTYRQ